MEFICPNCEGTTVGPSVIKEAALPGELIEEPLF